MKIGGIRSLVPMMPQPATWAAGSRNFVQMSSKTTSPDRQFPGFIETSGAHGMILDISKGTGAERRPPAIRSWTCWEGFPSGGQGTPETVAELACFLASDRAGFVIGADYILDGGTMPTF